MKTFKFIHRFKTISMMLLMCMLLTGKMHADTGGTVYAAGVSKYLWRGFILAEGTVQPGLDLNYKKLSVGIWASYNTAESSAFKKNSFGEADVTISFSDNFNILGYSLGYTYYTFPNLLPGYGSSSEYFLGLSADTFLSPGLTFYWDVQRKSEGGGDGLYAEVTISFPFKLGLDFGLDASAGYNAGQWGMIASPTILGLTLGTTFSIGPIDISPAVYGQQALDKKYKNGDKDIDGYISLSTGYNF